MELMFVVLIGAGLGFLGHYTLPGRETRGALLLGSVAAAVTAVVWVALLWLGLTFDGGWIWVAAIVAAGLATIALALIAPGRRRAADAAMLHELSGGRA